MILRRSNVGSSVAFGLALSCNLALVVGLSSPGRAAEQAAPKRLLISPFGYLDTSGEPRDQRAEHAERLAAMSKDLGASLEASGRFKVLPAPDGAARCQEGEGECLLSQARTAGADLVLAGAVQKVSTMASSVWVGAFEATTGKRVFFRQMTFRGDTDEAWQHATAFMAREIRDDSPALQ